MGSDCFWLTDEQFARLEPHLPTKTRGVPRVDDRRVISGIVHVLRSAGRWADAPAVRGARRRGRRAVARHDRQLRREGSPLGRRRQRGSAARRSAARAAAAPPRSTRSRTGRVARSPSC